MQSLEAYPEKEEMHLSRIEHSSKAVIFSSRKIGENQNATSRFLNSPKAHFGCSKIAQTRIFRNSEMRQNHMF